MNNTLHQQLTIGTGDATTARHALRQLSVQTITQLAGYISPRTDNPLLDTCERDLRPMCHDRIALVYFSRVKNRALMSILWQLIAIIEARGERLPDEYLPILLGLVEHVPYPHCNYVWEFAGQTGKWLAEQDAYQHLVHRSFYDTHHKFCIDDTVYLEQKLALQRMIQDGVSFLFDIYQAAEIYHLRYYPWDKVTTQLFMDFLKSAPPLSLDTYTIKEILKEFLYVAHIELLQDMCELLITTGVLKEYATILRLHAEFRIQMLQDMNPDNLPLKTLDFWYE